MTKPTFTNRGRSCYQQASNASVRSCYSRISNRTHPRPSLVTTNSQDAPRERERSKSKMPHREPYSRVQYYCTVQFRLWRIERRKRLKTGGNEKKEKTVFRILAGKQAHVTRIFFFFLRGERGKGRKGDFASCVSDYCFFGSEREIHHWFFISFFVH